MSSQPAEHSLKSFTLLLCVSLCVGCGSTGPITTTTPPPTTPQSGTEFLYQNTITGWIYDGAITVASVDPTTGVVGAPVEVTETLASRDAFVEPTPMSPPSSTFVYTTGTSVNGTGLFAFKIVGATGGLSAIADPYIPAVAWTDPQSALMSGNGKFIYVSDYAGSSGSTTSYLRTYPVNLSDGTLSEGPTWSTTTSDIYLDVTLAATDSLGKYVYAWFSSEASLGLGAFSIDQTTGALTAVPGSPYVFYSQGPPYVDAPFGPLNAVVAPSGDYVYAGGYTISNLSQDIVSIFAFAVDPTSGALTPVAGSPYTLADFTPYKLAIHPNGKFLYVSGRSSDPTSPGYYGGVWVYPLDPASGAIASTAVSISPAKDCCAANVFDPSGAVLVNVNNYESPSDPSPSITSFQLDGSTGAATQAAVYPGAGGTSGLIVKIP
jgi:hypothetical protein